MALDQVKKYMEEIISESDSLNTYEFENYFVILPSSYNKKIYDLKYKNYKKSYKVKWIFLYFRK